MEEGVYKVLSTNGDTHLGGEDFDHRLVKHCLKEFKKTTGRDLSDSKKAIRRLRTACERSKRLLSTSAQTMIEIQMLDEGDDFSCLMSRANFENICLDLFNTCFEPLDKAMTDSKLKKSEIDEIVMVGGSTRIPKI